MRLAATASAAPREMVRRLKTTMRGMCAVCAHGEAVHLELKQQLWSIDQPEFKKRLAALKERLKR
jgi:hypothetical protein